MFKEPAANYWSRDMPVDPNEPIYCNCRRVAYGEMICCDNTEVRVKELPWFDLNAKKKHFLSVSRNGTILDALD